MWVVVSNSTSREWVKWSDGSSKRVCCSGSDGSSRRWVIVTDVRSTWCVVVVGSSSSSSSSGSSRSKVNHENLFLFL